MNTHGNTPQRPWTTTRGVIARGALLLALALLAGCVETRFESPLGDNIETCDARWKGLWIGSEGNGELDLDAVTAFHVDDECAFSVIEQPEPGGAGKRVRVPLNSVHAHGRDYLIVADASLAGLVDLQPPHGIDPPPQRSFFFARYRVRGDRIELHPVDSKAVAKLVVDGELDGTLEKTRTVLRVYVRGSRAQMLAMVRKHAIFEKKPTLVLRRSPLDLDAFERALRERQAGQEPRR